MFLCGLSQEKTLSMLSYVDGTISRGSLFTVILFIFGVTNKSFEEKIICGWKLGFVYVAASVLGRVNAYSRQS